jgi:hypothetical protein
VAADRSGSTAQAGAVSGLLGLIRLCEKRNVPAARSLGCAGRPAIHASRGHGENKLPILAAVTGQNRLPAQVLILVVISLATALVSGGHLHHFRQVEYRIGCHNADSLEQGFLVDHPNLAVKAKFSSVETGLEFRLSYGM